MKSRVQATIKTDAGKRRIGFFRLWKQNKRIDKLTGYSSIVWNEYSKNFYATHGESFP